MTAQGCQNPPAPDQGYVPSVDFASWHVYTQEWGPGYRSYYIDGKYVYTSTNKVWSQPERWQLQVEPSPLTQNQPDGGLGQSDGGTGHAYISWVWIGKPDY
jgi:beta-glucanase (GH16 family)